MTGTRRRFTALGLMLACASCGDGPSAVVGTIAYRFVGRDTPQTVPADLSSSFFQVYVEDDAAVSGFRVYPADAPVAGKADGSFEIADVPSGPFWLRMTTGSGAQRFSYETAHDVAWTWDVLGRPDAQPAIMSTPLTLSASGLAPWGANDVLVANCWSNATEHAGVAALIMPALVEGATIINGSFAWSKGYSWGPRSGPYLMDASVDDGFVLSRISASTMGDIDVETLTQVLMTPAVTQTNGQAATVTGTFNDVSLTTGVSFTIDRDRVVAAMPRGTVVTSFGAGLLVGPGTGSGLRLGPALLSVTSKETTGTLTFTGSFGNPFDPAWPVLAEGFVAVESSSIDGILSHGFLRHSSVLQGGSFTFVMPPFARAPRLDGAPLGEQPIAWDGVSAIELDLGVDGEVTHTSAAIYRQSDTSSILVEEVATVSSNDGRLLVPPELLRKGTTYVLRMGAWNASGTGPASGSYLISPRVVIAP